MSQAKILLNKARCKKCGDTIESKFTHDFQWCKCGAIAVDGGKSYLKRVGSLDAIEELSEYLENGDTVRAKSPAEELEEELPRTEIPGLQTKLSKEAAQEALLDAERTVEALQWAADLALRRMDSFDDDSFDDTDHATRAHRNIALQRVLDEKTKLLEFTRELARQ